jgi:phosphopantetheine adenylyltransferase
MKNPNEIPNSPEKAKKIYNYEAKRIAKYKVRLESLLNRLDLSKEDREEIERLFTWNGAARAIMSKAYQEMKELN